MTYQPPRPLERSDDLDDFVCDSVEQTTWLVRHARQSEASGATRVFVVTTADSDHVVAYYAWTMASIAVTSAPTRLRRGAGRYPQPVALLARLGVHRDHERRGLGAALVRDVMQRAASISDEIGCRGLLVHCETSQARAFYEYLVPELDRSPTDGMHLVVMLKDIRQTLRGGGGA